MRQPHTPPPSHAALYATPCRARLLCQQHRGSCALRATTLLRCRLYAALTLLGMLMPLPSLSWQTTAYRACCMPFHGLYARNAHAGCTTLRALTPAFCARHSPHRAACIPYAFPISLLYRWHRALLTRNITKLSDRLWFGQNPALPAAAPPTLPPSLLRNAARLYRRHYCHYQTLLSRLSTPHHKRAYARNRAAIYGSHTYRATCLLHAPLQRAHAIWAAYRALPDLFSVYATRRRTCFSRQHH